MAKVKCWGKIGAVYIMSGLIGGSIGFGLSIILRLELALPGLSKYLEVYIVGLGHWDWWIVAF